MEMKWHTHCFGQGGQKETICRKGKINLAPDWLSARLSSSKAIELSAEIDSPFFENLNPPILLRSAIKRFHNKEKE
jgi:hypothetical protein